jgi:hypothetical protein
MDPPSTAPTDREPPIILEYILLGDLRELLTEPPTAHTRHALLVVLDALLDAISLRLRAGEDYLTEVLDERPNWSRQVEALRRGHAADQARLAELRDHIHRGVSFAAVAEQIARDLAAWMESLAANRHDENRLEQMAVNRDHGGEG